LNAATFGWLVLAFPLAGSIGIALGWTKLSGRAAGWIGSAAIGLAFVGENKHKVLARFLTVKAKFPELGLKAKG